MCSVYSCTGNQHQDQVSQAVEEGTRTSEEWSVVNIVWPRVWILQWHYCDGRVSQSIDHSVRTVMRPELSGPRTSRVTWWGRWACPGPPTPAPTPTSSTRTTTPGSTLRSRRLSTETTRLCERLLESILSVLRTLSVTMSCSSSQSRFLTWTASLSERTCPQ